MDLVSRYPIISDQIEPAELRVILRELEFIYTHHVPGDIVELGCFEGTTSLFFQRVIKSHPELLKLLHIYDSFEGLPEKTSIDQSPSGEQFKGGGLKASKNKLINNFKQAGLNLPIIHKGWFGDLSPRDMPNEISFAFLDGDFYESIIDSLKLVWPKLTPGATVIVDDYQAEALPGARRAVDDWLINHPAKIRVEASLAILKVS